MLSKEEIKEVLNANVLFAIQKDVCLSARVAVEDLLAYVEQLEKINEKYLQKLVYALTPTTHTLGTKTNDEFKKIIAENIDLETCKITRKLKEYWGIDKY